MLTTIIGVFIILHGLVHAGLAAAPNPDDPESKPGQFFTAPARSWLFQRLGVSEGVVKWVGIGLVALSTIGFVIAGLGVLGIFGLGAVWPPVAIASAVISLLLLVIFWQRWLILGILIDIGVLVWTVPQL